MSRVEQRGRLDGETCAAAPASVPIHMIGATTGRAIRFASRLTTDTRPKWNASSGAVASVAATVIALASASAAGSRSKPLAQMRHEAEDPDHGREAELPAGVEPCARVEQQREGDRQQQRVPARRRAAGQRRDRRRRRPSRPRA